MRNRVYIFILLFLLFFTSYWIGTRWSEIILFIFVAIWWLLFVLSKKYQSWQERYSIKYFIRNFIRKLWYKLFR